MEDILEDLQDIFRDVLKDSRLTLTGESALGSVDDWDSLARINLIVSLEKRYKLRFAPGELESLDARDILKIVETKLAAISGL